MAIKFEILYIYRELNVKNATTPTKNTKERPIIKQEAMTPIQAMNMTNGPGSVNMLSVRPAPPSVSIGEIFVRMRTLSKYQSKSEVIKVMF